MRLHVMHAQDARATLVCAHGRRNARSDEILAVHEPPQRALAREADEHRTAERKEHVETAHEVEIVLERLAEADPGIEADAVLTHAARDREAHALLEECSYLARD